MSAFIYIEGGAGGPKSKYLNIACQRAFHKLLDSMGFKDRKPHLVACGGRHQVYDRFCTKHKEASRDYVAMWIDSEDPMADPERAWQHLKEVKTVQAWQQPAGAEDDQVLFMTTCMETWIVADREGLRSHYRQGLQETALPSLHELEERPRHDVQDRLERATRQCRNQYAKGKRSFEVLAVLNPSALVPLPSYARALGILKKKL